MVGGELRVYWISVCTFSVNVKVATNFAWKSWRHGYRFNRLSNFLDE